MSDPLSASEPPHATATGAEDGQAPAGAGAAVGEGPAQKLPRLVPQPDPDPDISGRLRPDPGLPAGPVAGAARQAGRLRGRAGRIAGRAVRGTWRFLWLWISAGLVFTSIFTGLLLYALNDAPITLPAWLTQRIEAQLNQGLPAGQVSVSSIEVDLRGAGTSRVRLRDLRLRDATGAEVAVLNQVGTEFQVAGLLRGNFIPQRLDLIGAQMTLRRRVDGSFDLSFGAMGGVAGSLPQILERVDRMFSEGPLSRIRTVQANDLTVTLEDGRSARIWQVTGGRLNLEQTPERLEIGLVAEVFNGTEDLASVTGLVQAEKGSMALRAAAAVENARSGDIALQSPALAFLSAIDAPIGGAVQVTVSDEGRVSAVSARLSLGAGELTPALGAGQAGSAAPGPQPGTENPAGAAPGGVGAVPGSGAALPGQTGAPLTSPGGAEPAAAPAPEPVERIAISGGEMFLVYDPERQRIDFNQLRILTDRADLELTGQSWLEDLRPGGWPESFVGQFSLTRLAARDATLLTAPVEFHDGQAEVKLTLRPLRLELGRLRLGSGQEAIDLSGALSMTPRGPDLALNIHAPVLQRDRLMALWPPAMAAPTRSWLEANLSAARFTDLRMGLRRPPGAPRMQMVLDTGFDSAVLKAMPGLPPVTGAAGYVALGQDRVFVAAEQGQVEAPQGGTVDLAGSSFSSQDLRERPIRAAIDLKARGPLTAVLSLLDQPPMRALERAGQPVDLALGMAEGTARITLPIRRGLTPDDITYQAEARLSELTSDRLVPGREVTAGELIARTDGKGLTITGLAALDGLPAQITWDSAFAPGSDPPVLRASVSLDPPLLRSFGISLPQGMVSGAAQGQLELRFPRGEAPAFSLTSDLRGAVLRLPELGWSKPAGQAGRLLVSGRLGSPAQISRFELEGGGLALTGQILLSASGGFREARFDRLRLNGWLDAPVTLRAEGAGLAVEVRGGTLDFRKAKFGSSGSGAGSGAGMPVTVALDRLIVTDNIDLTGFRGNFSTRGGFGGTFTARLNGGGQIEGRVAPQNGGTALKVVSQDAGSVLRDSGMATRIRGGAMELILVPTGQQGIYNGSLSAERLRVRGTPALAELIAAASVVGLLQQLNGDGIVFDQVEARFLLTPNAVNLTEARAMGASMGITAQGSYLLADGSLDLQGVFSPLFVVNSIGQIFGRRGEGLFGLNYSLRGTAEQPKVSVNPLSALTPGAFRDIFRSAPPVIR